MNRHAIVKSIPKLCRVVAKHSINIFLHDAQKRTTKQSSQQILVNRIIFNYNIMHNKFSNKCSRITYFLVCSLMAN